MNIYENLQLKILEFIPDEYDILFNFLLTNKLYKHALEDRLNTVYWEEVDNIIEEEDEVNKMKQGNAFSGALDLNINQIDTKGCKILTPVLAKMTALKTLRLGSNQIDSKGCEHLAPALAKMTSLKRLYLDNNQIDAKGCEQLAPSLAEMTALEWLDLGGNQIDAEGCEYLSPALAKMTTLITLDLSYNKIDADGCEHLVSAILGKMTALRRLRLDNNQIDVIKLMRKAKKLYEKH